jgi:glycine/D-amino acid oxidase-like deaminating enzyme
MATSKPDTVAIVGAGIAGLCTALHLKEKGVERVVLLDKGKVGSGSSSKSGAVNTMLMPTETGTRARAITMDIFERFSKILDNYSFHQVGCMFILSEQQYLEAEQEREMHCRVGARFEVLRRGEVEKRFPALRIKDDEYCILDLRGGWNEPDTYIAALSARVREMGVEVREDEPVEEFILEDAKVKGVRTRKAGELRADAVVCTLNAWANSLLATVDQRIPAHNYVHERFVTTPFAAAPNIPATNDNATQVYFRPTEDNRLLFGTNAHEPVRITLPGIDFDYSQLELHHAPEPFIKEAVGERLPMMEGVEFAEHRIGLISMTADTLPNIGPVAALPGLFLGCNFNSGGFGYHAVAGLLLSEFIVDGQTRIDVAEFSPDRFKDFDVDAFLATKLGYKESWRPSPTNENRKTPMVRRH